MIYFIQSADGHIKIGTTNDLAKRLNGLQSAAPLRLAVLGVMPGGGKVESALHSRFGKHRINGEWFRPHADVTDYIAAHTRAVPEAAVVLEKDPMPRAQQAAECDVALVDLGARIRRARIRRRLTSEDVSLRTGMSRPTYRAIERGERGVAIGRVVDVLREFQMLADVSSVASADQLGRAIIDGKALQASRVRKAS